MKLVKHFDFSNDSELDLNDWSIAVGEKWANNELQHYVDKKENLYFDNGLVIKGTNTNGVYESARIHTKHKFFIKYGKIEIIAKLPKGIGTWPALWMMPEEDKFGHWPKSGEIDIMEHVGREVDHVFFCLHTEDYNHTKGNDYYKKIHYKGLTDDFQKYTLEWSNTGIRYLLNDKEIVHYVKGADGKNSKTSGWPFDENFYLLINMAIGGKFGGAVDDSCLPQKFIVKDIKIYQ